jgi:RHS repeat-associated protein
MEAEILSTKRSACEDELLCAPFFFRSTANCLGNLFFWLMPAIVMASVPLKLLAACDGCITPITGEWRYQANSCSSFIPPEGYIHDEASLVEQVRDATDNCPEFTVFTDTGWPVTSQYFGGICGGGANVPILDATFQIERYNRRAITSECGGYDLHRWRDIACPGNTIRHYDNAVPYYYRLCKAEDHIVSRDKNLGVPKRCAMETAGSEGNPSIVGNPVNVAYGNKLQVETDLAPTPVTGLDIRRIYNSRDRRTNQSYRFGTGWRSGHDHSLTYVSQPPQGDILTDTETVFLHRPDGKVYYFTHTGGHWETDGDTPGSVTGTTGGWQYTTADDAIEEYDSSGKLTRITTVSGITTSYTYYPSDYIKTVTTSLGESLTYSYDTDGRINAITDHTGRVWKYSYDANNNLEFVSYPDGTPLDDTDNPVRQYHYEDINFPNALTGITDERSIRYAHFEYDTAGRPIAIYHGPQTSVLTDRIEGVFIGYSGSKRTVTNSKGINSTYITDTRLGVALVTEITGPGCATCGTGNTGYIYDPLTNDLLTKTENGITTEYGNYDANGNPGYRIEATGTTEERRTEYTYDPNYTGKLATITEPSVFPGADKVTTYTYDGFGNRTSETISGYDPAGIPVSRTTTYQYNGPLHQLTRIDGPRDNVTDVADITILRYYPDDPEEGANRARLKEIEDAAGVLIRSNIQYTATGKVASEERPNGLSLSYTYYPGNDRLATLTEADGTNSKVTRWAYEATGQVQSLTTAAGTSEATTLTFTYDAARRLTRITDGLGNYIEYALDTEGNREAENIHDGADVLHKALTQTFDIYNRLDTTSQANESVDYDYAADGTLDQQTDGKGTVTDYSYDALKRLLATTRDLSGLGAMTQYGYDVADNLTSVIDPVDGMTTYHYDDLGNLLQTSSPDAGTTVFTYDAAGNLTSRQDARGQLFIYIYDALNRLNGIDAPGTNDDITYVYDTCTHGSGRLCSVITPSGTVTYAYDAFGNVTSHQLLEYSYDLANRVQTITYPSGAVITYGYDAAGQVSEVNLTDRSTTTTLAGNITYAPFGAVESLTYGSGATLTHGVDSAYRLTSQSIPGVLDLGYTLYDANGNLETRTDSYSSSTSFAYDPLNRLDTAHGAFGSRDYDHDLNGNRTSLVSDALTTTYGYTPRSNRLTSETGRTYTLDANGNTTHRLDVDGLGRLYSYNAHNRLATAAERQITGYTGKGKNRTPVIGEVSLATYAYNGLGQRVRKMLADGTVSQYLYRTDGALLAELDDSDTPMREYVYLNGQLLAVLDRSESSGGGGGEEIIVDEGDTGTASTGSWTPKNRNKANEGDYLLAAGGTSSTYRWTPALAAGTYDVYVWYVKHNTHSSNVPYSIVHDGQATMASLDQSSGGNVWYPIATGISFDGSGYEYVEVSDANGKTTADAVKFVSVGGSGGTITAVYYVHNDDLGTPQAMTDENGNEVWRSSYDPFGRATIDAASTFELNVRFPSQYFDQETGLHYNYFRYYDPEIDRYLTSDPIGLAGGINPYLYAEANPIKNIDPLGLDTVTYGSTLRLPTWIAAPVAKMLGLDTTPNGIAIGVAASFPGFFGGEFDSGIFASLDLGGFEAGAKVTEGFSYNKGSVCDLVGVGVDVGVFAGVLGGGVALDNNGDVTGIYFQRGLGLGGGYNATGTLVLSNKHGFIGF